MIFILKADSGKHSIKSLTTGVDIDLKKSEIDIVFDAWELFSLKADPGLKFFRRKMEMPLEFMEDSVYKRKVGAENLPHPGISMQEVNNS